MVDQSNIRRGECSRLSMSQRFCESVRNDSLLRSVLASHSTVRQCVSCAPPWRGGSSGVAASSESSRSPPRSLSSTKVSGGRPDRTSTSRFTSSPTPFRTNTFADPQSPTIGSALRKRASVERQRTARCREVAPTPEGSTESRTRISATKTTRCSSSSSPLGWESLYQVSCNMF